jgi:hypothetical protein
MTWSQLHERMAFMADMVDVYAGPRPDRQTVA